MPPRKSRILYVGNSFTTRNDLPSLLAGLAAADGKGTMVEHEVVAVGGASLRQHLNSGKAAGLLERSHWNYVVLQEQSTLPVKNAARMHDNVRDFHSLIDETGAETVLARNSMQLALAKGAKRAVSFSLYINRSVSLNRQTSTRTVTPA